VAQTIKLLTCIGDMPGPNLGRKAGILKFFVVSLSPWNTKALRKFWFAV